MGYSWDRVLLRGKKKRNFVAQRGMFYRMKKLLSREYIDVILAVVVVALLSLGLLSVKALPIGLCLILVYVVSLVVYRRVSFYSNLGRIALSFAFVSMAVFLLLNYWQSTVCLGTDDKPFLLYDAQTFYILSHDIFNNCVGQHSPPVPYMGYPLFLSWWLHCGIDNIAYPTIFNVLLILLSMILVGRICSFIIEKDDEAKRVAAYAMLLIALIPGVLGTATLLSKEPFVIFAMTACVCAMYAIRRQQKSVLYIILFLLGIFILAYMRTTYLYILLLFVAGVWLYKIKRSDVLPTIVIVAIIVVAIYDGSMQSWWQDSAFVKRYISPHAGVTFFSGISQEPLQNLIGPYYLYPLWLKLVILPVTVAVQFIIPFPFESVVSPVGHPISMTVYHRMSYLWYLAAVPMLCYYLFYWWRSGGKMMSIFALVAAVAYCVPAFITAGSISRYAYCFVPFLAIMGGYVLMRVLDNRSELKRMGVFALVYAVVIVAALFIGAHPQLLYALIG